MNIRYTVGITQVIGYNSFLIINVLEKKQSVNYSNMSLISEMANWQSYRTSEQYSVSQTKPTRL